MGSCISSTSTEFLEKPLWEIISRSFVRWELRTISDAATFEEFMVSVHSLVDDLTRAMEEIVQSLDRIGQTVGESAGYSSSEIAGKDESSGRRLPPMPRNLWSRAGRRLPGWEQLLNEFTLLASRGRISTNGPVTWRLSVLT